MRAYLWNSEHFDRGTAHCEFGHPSFGHNPPDVMHCIYNGNACSTGTKAICAKSELIRQEEVEQSLWNSPILIYEQGMEGELRYVYYGETDSGRLLAIIVVERGEKIRVVTAYDLDAGAEEGLPDAAGTRGVML